MDSGKKAPRLVILWMGRLEHLHGAHFFGGCCLHISLSGVEFPVLSIIGFLHMLILMPLQPQGQKKTPQAAGFSQPNECSLLLS